MRSGNLISSFNFAIEGVVYVIKTQRNMKVHFFVAMLVLVLALVLNVTRFELLVILVTIGMVMAVEMLNTAVEEIVNLVTKKAHPLARTAKNIAAGAVLVVSIMAVGVGYLIFFDKIMAFETEIMYRYLGSYHLTLIALMLVIGVSILVKAYTGSTNYLRGGMPSGHSAISFSLATAIAFIGTSFTAILGFVLALLVAHSRVQSRIHTVYEVLIGSMIGFLVTLLLFQLKA